jgi:hypothetical protein
MLEKSIFIIPSTDYCPSSSNLINYKPDFFIYNEDYTKLLKIVEVKQGRKDAEPYFDFKDYFSAIGIEYEVEWGIDKIKRRWTTREELELWDSQYLENYPDLNMAGELNPMYGMKHTDATKKKIGQKTKKYMADKKIKDKQIASIKAFWASDDAKPIKEKYAAMRHDEAEKNNPWIDGKCIFCEKDFKKKLHDQRQTCSASCSQKYNWKTGKMEYRGNATKTYKTRIVKYLKLATETITTDNLEDIVKKLKDGGLVPKHFSLNRKVIEKYFGSVEKAVLEL